MMRSILSLLALILICNLVFGQENQSFFVEGYTDQLSYLPGDQVHFHLSSSEDICHVAIRRLGLENTLVWEMDSLPVQMQHVPERASTHGCDWPVTHSLKIPEDWQTGYYEVSLQIDDEGGTFVHRNRRSAEGAMFFVVRSARPGQNTKILLQLATNTYNAYNNWGGSSLYGYHGRANLQGHRVSFDRPPRSLFYRWEHDFIKWAEKNGYVLDYAVNSDLEFRPEVLEHYNLVLSVGHDEYWSTPMRDHLEAYIENGGHVAFFSGNSVCWQVRSEDEGRALTCWKQWYNMDPVYQTDDHSKLSTLWGHHLVDRPENELTGVGFLHGGYHRSHGQFMDGSGAYTVHRPDHWLFEGTDLQPDQEFGGKHTVVGYECDGCEMTLVDGLPEPTHRDGTPDNFVILATAPARWHPDDSWWYERWDKDRIGHAVLGTYTNGGTVVTVGSTDWAHGLRGGDDAVEQITKNVLDKLSID
ncbi:MAG: hypothetical protein HKN87_04030 [Saprospiraceae bacterium]|nr:hypothetical protein [Saprospiraceae bacterium]